VTDVAQAASLRCLSKRRTLERKRLAQNNVAQAASLRCLRGRRTAPIGRQDEDMGNLDYKLLYRRNLPHFQPIGGTFFITFRLAGSLPQAVLRRWASENVISQRQRRRLRPASTSGTERGDGNETDLSPEQAFAQTTLEINRRRFIEFETLLHRVAAGPTWLADDRVAKIVADAITYRSDTVYSLDAYCIMPNHVHLVFSPLPDSNRIPDSTMNAEEAERSLSSIMHSLKTYTAHEANKVLAREGQFWERENYDHMVRDEAEWLRTLAYVVNNPVKARLVQDWREWRFSYCRLLVP
jgi:putative transposase